MNQNHDPNLTHSEPTSEPRLGCRGDRPSAHWKRSFFTIAAGQTVSLIGSSAVQFALIWWIAVETGSAMMMSYASLLAFLPQLLLGPFVGVWVDRLKRKTVIICADLFTGLVAAGFAAAFFVSDPPVWSACLVLGARALGGVFHTPAIQSAIPMLVPKEKLVQANGWSQFMQSGSFMLGPVLGAAMYAELSLPVILITDLVGALVASGTVALVRIPDPPRQEHTPHFFREMKQGALLFVRDKRLGVVTLASTLCMIFGMPLSTYYPLMTSNYFGLSAWHAGAVEFAYALGMMLCAILAGVLGHMRRKLLAVHFGLIGMGLTALFGGLVPPTMSGFWAFACLCLLMGASINLYNIPYVAYMQETVPHEAQGRAFSLMGSLMSLTMPLGLVIAGPIAESAGVAVWFVITGVAFLCITAVSLLLMARTHPTDPSAPSENDA